MKAMPSSTIFVFLAFVVGGVAQQSQSVSANFLSTNTHGWSVSFSPDGKLLQTNSTAGTMRIWDLRSGKSLAAPPAHFGTWQLLSFKHGEGAQWSNMPDTRRRIKGVTESHFTLVEYDTASGKVRSVAGGTYTLNEQALTESFVYASEGMTNYPGTKQSLKIRVEGDKLYESSELADGTKIEEVWQRTR